MDFDISMLKELDASILNELASTKIAPSELTTHPDRGSSIYDNFIRQIQADKRFERLITTITTNTQSPARSQNQESQFVSIPRFSNCPNCGAPVNNNRCEYCGTDFYSFIQEE